MTELSTATDTSQSAYLADEDEISLLDLLQTIAENLRLLVLGPVVAGLVALGAAFTITPTFTAKATFLPPQQQQSAAASMLASLGALGGLAGAATGIKSPNDQFITFMQSRASLDAIIDEFKLMGIHQSENRESARTALLANSKIAAGKDGVITIEVDDASPERAASIANGYIEQLGILLNRMAVTEAQQRRTFFERQLKDTQLKLNESEAALQASGIDVSILKTNPEVAVGALAELQAQIAAQEIKIASMRGYLTESAPGFRQAMTELRALQAQLGKTAASSNGINSTSQSNLAMGSGKDDYTQRYRDYRYNTTLLELFAKQFEIAKIDEAREGAVIQVLDPAIAPINKSKPKRALIAIITALAAGFLLLIFVFVKAALNNAGADPETSLKLARIKSSLQAALGR